MTPARSKAEEVLRVLNDVAEDLLLEAGEAAVEEFWAALRDSLDAREKARKESQAEAERRAWEEGREERDRQRAAEQERMRQWWEQWAVAMETIFPDPRPNSASPTEDPGRAGTPPVPADSSSGNPPV